MMSVDSSLKLIAMSTRFQARVILLGILAIVLSSGIQGCAATSTVVSDHDPNLNYSLLRKYAWLEYSTNANTERDISALTLARIKASIDTNLAGKNYTIAKDADAVDFLISFSVGLEDRKERFMSSPFLDEDSETSFSLGWGDDYYEPGAMVEIYSEGSLAIDIFDTENLTPIWHGYASKRLEPADQQDDGGRSIQEGVNAIMATFPPE